MSRQDWRVRLPTAPHTTLTALANPPLPKRIGRPKKSEGTKEREAKEAARALVHAQIAKEHARRTGKAFTVESTMERMNGSRGYKTTAYALLASGAVPEVSEVPEESGTRGTLDARAAHGPRGALNTDPDRGDSAPVHVETIAGRALGAERQGAVVSVRDDAALRAALDGGAAAVRLHPTELAPAPEGGLRVRTENEAEESIIRYIHTRMLSGAWTDEQCVSLGKELHRAEHTMRMYVNRARGRMAEPVAQASVHDSIYRRSRVLSDIAMENYMAVHEPSYAAAAIRALELELKASALLPKELPPVKSPAEMERALLVALERVRAMGGGAPAEGSEGSEGEVD